MSDDDSVTDLEGWEADLEASLLALRRDIKTGLGLIAGMLLVHVKQEGNYPNCNYLPVLVRRLETSLDAYLKSED